MELIECEHVKKTRGDLEIVAEDGFVRLQSLNDDGSYHWLKFTPEAARKLAGQLGRFADAAEKQR